MAKGNGEGSLRYLEDSDRYQYRVSYKNKDGKTCRKSFYAPKASQAKKKAREWLDFYEDTNKGEDINPPLDEWIYTWLNLYMRNTVRPSTLEKYTSCLTPVCNAFSGIRLSKIEPIALQQFFQQQLFNGGQQGQGLSTLTVRNQRRYLSSCFDMAIRLGLTNKNPVKLTLPPKVEKKEIYPLSDTEVRTVLEIALNDVELAKEKGNIGETMSAQDLYIGVMIAVYTGMRLGEIMALKWSDLSVSTSFLSVQRSKSDVKGQAVTSPKTGKGRKVQIGSALLEALLEHKKLQQEYKKILGNLYKDDGWIIGGLFGDGYNKRHYSSRKFQQLVKKAQIVRHIRFHDLRHTHATLLLLSGINPKVVQERLGHASIDMTLDTYSHLTLANQGSAVKALDSMMENSKDM